jgi:hypothetical protein
VFILPGGEKGLKLLVDLLRVIGFSVSRSGTIVLLESGRSLTFIFLKLNMLINLTLHLIFLGFLYGDPL